VTKPYHPWTNGQAERMNRTIKDATVKVFHYEDLESLKAHVLAFVTAYNFATNVLSVAEYAERLRPVAVDEEVGFGNEALEQRPVRRLPWVEPGATLAERHLGLDSRLGPVRRIDAQYVGAVDHDGRPQSVHWTRAAIFIGGRHRLYESAKNARRLCQGDRRCGPASAVA
jgi:hypothetical protein